MGNVISIFLLIASKGVGWRARIDTYPIVDCVFCPSIERTEDCLHTSVCEILAEGGDGSGGAYLDADVDLGICEGSIVDGSSGIGTIGLAGQGSIMTIEAPGALGNTKEFGHVSVVMDRTRTFSHASLTRVIRHVLNR